jgi:hypothetical protein
MQSFDDKEKAKVIILALQELIILKAAALAKLYTHVEKQNHHDPRTI